MDSRSFMTTAAHSRHWKDKRSPTCAASSRIPARVVEISSHASACRICLRFPSREDRGGAPRSGIGRGFIAMFRRGFRKLPPVPRYARHGNCFVFCKSSENFSILRSDRSRRTKVRPVGPVRAKRRGPVIPPRP
jgi:hypothetical protein